MNKKAIIPLVVLLVLTTGYLVFKLTAKTGEQETGGSGTIEVTEVDISGKISGRIEQLNAEEGGSVKAGQLLAVLAHDELKAQQESAAEQVKQLKLQATNAKDNYKRAKVLLSAGGYSKQAFDRDETLFQVTAHQYESSVQNLIQIKAQAENAFLYAPIDGVVLLKSVEIGEIASPGMSLMTIGDLSKPWLKIYIPEYKIGKIRLGDTATVYVDSYPGKTFKGTITYISSKAEFTPKNVQTKEDRVRLVYAVKLALDNKEGIFKPGMPADAVINVANN